MNREDDLLNSMEEFDRIYNEKVVFTKKNRKFKGSMKTKDILQFATITFSDYNGDVVFANKGKLIEMYRKVSGGSYHTFEIEMIDRKIVNVPISHVISYENPNEDDSVKGEKDE